MHPENFSFGGGSAETLLHPVVMVAMILATILILALPRKYVVVPFLLGAFLIPFPQTLIIGGLHLFVYRILILVAWARLAVTKFSSGGGLFAGRLDKLDKYFFCWAIFRASAFLIRFSFQAGALINQASFLVDALGAYFLLRYLIQDKEDIYRVVKTFAVIATIDGVTMLNELFLHQNVFGYLGGIPIVPAFREGLYRCQGPFRNPILAGCFGAATVPAMLLLWKAGKSKALAAAGFIGSTIVMVAAASSTSYLAWAAGIGAIFLWSLRKKMRVFRWGIVIALVGLQLVMKAPVWFVITHFQLLGGSSNYHRALLIDMFMRHFSEWWLIGTNNNGNWGWDMWDNANQFVAEGVTGGLLTLICFIGIISICFGRIGKMRKQVEGDRKQEWFLWFLGTTLLANIVAFSESAITTKLRSCGLPSLRLSPPLRLP